MRLLVEPKLSVEAVKCKYCDTVHGQLFDVVCPSRNKPLFADAKGEPDLPEDVERTPQYNFPVVEIKEGKVEIPAFVTPSGDQLGNEILSQLAFMHRNFKNNWPQRKRNAA